ncbi:MAG: hypothetical protein ABI874_08180, partial [Chloroflexota bacterium]
MLAWFYVLCVFLLAIYGVNGFLLTLIYWFKPRTPTAILSPCVTPRRASRFTAEGDCPLPCTVLFGAGEGRGGGIPIVTIQLPIFNERYVVERLLGA